MIIKPRTIPPHLTTLESILSRLPNFHPKKEEILLHLTNLKAGFQGEKSIDFPLSFIKETPHHIFHNIRLHDGQHFFQIDTLLLFQNAMIILEIKNIAGHLEFKTNYNQVIRTLNDQKEAFNDFHLQVERQKSQLDQWLLLNQFPSIPVIPLIVMANSRTIISSENHSVLQNVIPSAKIAHTVHQRIENIQVKKLKRPTFEKLSKAILNAHFDLHINWFERFQLSYADLKKGIKCLTCEHVLLQKKIQGWYCENCFTYSKNAHEVAIEELFLLKGEGLSNSEIRDFIGIKCPKATKRILMRMNLRIEGVKKTTRYFRIGNVVSDKIK